MELITLKTFDNPIDVHILRARLESEDITCFIFDENIVSVNPLYNITVGGIKLKVREDQYQLALEVLKDIDGTPYTDDNEKKIVCPKCNSEDIESGFRSVKGIAGIVSMIISFLFTVFPIYLSSKYRCNNCGTEFKIKSKDQ